MMICILLRDFAAAIERRNNPEYHASELIITTDSRVQRVVSTSHLPRQLGVIPGIALKQAQLIYPTAEVVLENGGAYQRAMDELTQQLMQFANKVDPEYQPTSSAFYLNTDTDLSVIQGFLSRVLKTTYGIGVAANKFTARVAAAQAAHQCGVVRVEKGLEGDFLSPFPVNLLPLSPDMKRRLPMLGIDTMGQLAGLPRIAIWEQFSKHGRWMHDLASGIDWRPIHPYQPPLILKTSHDFDTPVVSQEIIRNVLHLNARNLIDQLNKRESHRLTMLLYQENRTLIEAHVTPHQPIFEFLPFIRRLDDLLARQVISAPITAVEIHLSDIQEPQPRQLSLFDELDRKKNLRTFLPLWLRRHREIDLYYGRLMSKVKYTVPEYRSQLYEVRGA